MATLSRKDIDDGQMVARYLANQLSESERESFEAYFLSDPDALQELNRTAKFKSGLIDLHAAGELNAALNRRSWSPQLLALAASLTLAAVGIGMWTSWQHAPRPLIAASVSGLSHRFQSSLPIGASYHIERTRTSSYDATIVLPPHAAAVELKVKPERPSAIYRVSFAAMTSDSSTSKTFAAENLKPASDGFVSIFLNTAELKPAIYELKISSDAGKAPTDASSFLIEVAAKTG